MLELNITSQIAGLPSGSKKTKASISPRNASLKHNRTASSSSTYSIQNEIKMVDQKFANKPLPKVPTNDTIKDSKINSLRKTFFLKKPYQIYTADHQKNDVVLREDFMIPTAEKTNKNWPVDENVGVRVVPERIGSHIIKGMIQPDTIIENVILKTLSLPNAERDFQTLSKENNKRLSIFSKKEKNLFAQKKIKMMYDNETQLIESLVG